MYDVSDDIRAVRVLMFLARVMRGRSEGAYYRAAGQHLAHLRRKTSREYWIELVREECHLSPRRAYELMQIAEDAKALKELRLQKAARVRKTRKPRLSARTRLQQNQ
jgi:hypothetical protein